MSPNDQFGATTTQSVNAKVSTLSHDDTILLSRHDWHLQATLHVVLQLLLYIIRQVRMRLPWSVILGYPNGYPPNKESAIYEVYIVGKVE